MALTNRQRVDKGLEILRKGLVPYVERELQARLGDDWVEKIDQTFEKFPMEKDKRGKPKWDSQGLLKVMWDHWNTVFRMTLGHSERSLVSELRQVRKEHAHEEPVSYDDAYRALDSVQRLLSAVSASENLAELDKMKQEVMRVRFAEQARSQARRTPLVQGEPQEGLKPWREIVTPHEDVASGRYQQAEFAADLGQVYRGEGVDEYRDPHEFFRRTFLTDGLTHLLRGAALRLTGKGGDPVVELKTNFGGGKTHSMLGLYHLFARGQKGDLPGMEELLKEVGLKRAPEANRAVLVGTALTPGQSHKTDNGTTVRTLWGEMAWQLGGAEGYAMVSELDANGTSPGSKLLKDLFDRFGPCIVLIDEWVAFVRQTYGRSDLPAGSFGANMTFVQALTEGARAADRAMVVATLPASDIEIGGEGGREALKRIEHVFDRMESTWKPASPEEGFEIVRRRLFNEIADPANFAARDVVVKAFSALYRDQKQEFPSGCGEGEYQRELEACYPIHPELFRRLFEDWGGLERFQRTRGVLRLMAAVIHGLWERQDRSLLIMPSSIPIDNHAVQFELTRYMDESWDSVLSKDVDGPESLPLRVDGENPNFGRYSACRRVARTIYMGSAPTAKAKNPGIDGRAVRLGCVQPGETVATFGDALNRLAGRATYLYGDGQRYWYDTQPNVTRLAEDRAAQQSEEDVEGEIVRRLRLQQSKRGDFAGVHAVPESTGEAPDEKEARLVILGPGSPHQRKSGDSAARKEADKYLAERGNSPRVYRNMLVFLAPDHQRLGVLKESTKRYLAWDSIDQDYESEKLDLTKHSARQAKAQKNDSDRSVDLQLQEAWCWCLVPEQPEASGDIVWDEHRLQGQDPLAVRASKKLRDNEQLLTALGAARLEMELSKYLWKDANHIGVKRLWECMASYLYLPRLRDERVLIEGIQSGFGSSMFCEYFAYADSYDETSGRYKGLRTTESGSVLLDDHSALVKPEAATRQKEGDARKASAGDGRGRDVPDDGGGTRGGTVAVVTPPAVPKLPKRFHGSVELNLLQLGKQASAIAENVIRRLSVLPGAKVEVTMEIDVEAPEGVAEDVQRTVTENSMTLKFKSHGFEES